MALKLMYITNDPWVATVAENAGVDRIWIDLEWMGKESRQFRMDTVKSNHQIDDVAKLRPFVKKSELLVRVNPIHENSKDEINKVIAGGVDLIMLPYFHTVDEVQKFVKMVAGRAKVVLLVETKEAYEALEEIVIVPGVHEIHIGLNDLHLSYNLTFMFELLVNGIVEKACQIIGSAGIPYGFGGIAKIGEGLVPAENVIAEHYRLGSSMAILSRTFCDTRTVKDEETFKEVFCQGVKLLRDFEDRMATQSIDFFEDNHKIIEEKVKQIVEMINEKRRSKS